MFDRYGNYSSEAMYLASSLDHVDTSTYLSRRYLTAVPSHLYLKQPYPTLVSSSLLQPCNVSLQ